MKIDKSATNWFSKENIDKFVHREWNFPSVEQYLPAFFTALGGFGVATIVTLFASSALMPVRGKSAKATRSAPTAEVASTDPINNPIPLMADFTNISSRNIFNSEGSAAENGNGGTPICELKKSELPLKFTGVIFGGSAQTSLVVIESASSSAAATEAFLLFDIVPGNVQIVDITRSRVFIERNGCMEYLDLESIPLPKRRVAGTRVTRKPQMKSAMLDGDTIREDGFERIGNKVQVERRWVDKALGIDFAKTLQDAKANPNLVGGTEIKGFVLTKIRPNSAYEKMGLRDGDVVRSINNIELSGMAQAVQTLNQMRNESSISLLVDRGGQSINISLDVKR